MNTLLTEVIIDLQKELSTMTKPLNIVQIVPSINNMNSFTNIVRLKYDETLFDICGDLDINVKQIHLNSELENIYDDCRDTIERCNNDDNIHGILYGHPFEIDKFGSGMHSGIHPLKDMECIGALQLGRYMLKQQYTTIPCIQASIDMILRKNGMNEMKRIGIIQPSYINNDRFLPYHNTTNTYIISGFHDNTFMDFDLSGVDVIISANFNTIRRLNDKSLEWSEKLEANIAIDYGWTAKTYAPSIEYSVLSPDTKHFTVYTGLTELYILCALKNMVRLNKLV